MNKPLAAVLMGYEKYIDESDLPVIAKNSLKVNFRNTVGEVFYGDLDIDEIEDISDNPKIVEAVQAIRERLMQYSLACNLLPIIQAAVRRATLPEGAPDSIINAARGFVSDSVISILDGEANDDLYINFGSEDTKLDQAFKRFNMSIGNYKKIIDYVASTSMSDSNRNRLYAAAVYLALRNTNLTETQVSRLANKIVSH